MTCVTPFDQIHDLPHGACRRSVRPWWPPCYPRPQPRQGSGLIPPRKLVSQQLRGRGRKTNSASETPYNFRNPWGWASTWIPPFFVEGVGGGWCMYFLRKKSGKYWDVSASLKNQVCTASQPPSLPFSLPSSIVQGWIKICIFHFFSKDEPEFQKREPRHMQFVIPNVSPFLSVSLPDGVRRPPAGGSNGAPVADPPRRRRPSHRFQPRIGSAPPPAGRGCQGPRPAICPTLSCFASPPSSMVVGGVSWD